MTALMYFYMNYKNGFFSDILKVRRYPTMICYIDWISTTTLIVFKFLQLLGNDSKGSGIATMLIEADVIMILFGYIGETAINALKNAYFNLIGFVMFGVSMLAWMFILFILFYTLIYEFVYKLEPIKKGLNSQNYLFWLDR